MPFDPNVAIRDVEGCPNPRIRVWYKALSAEKSLFHEPWLPPSTTCGARCASRASFHCWTRRLIPIPCAVVEALLRLLVTAPQGAAESLLLTATRSMSRYVHWPSLPFIGRAAVHGRPRGRSQLEACSAVFDISTGQIAAPLVPER